MRRADLASCGGEAQKVIQEINEALQHDRCIA